MLYSLFVILKFQFNIYILSILTFYFYSIFFNLSRDYYVKNIWKNYLKKKKE